MKKVNLVFLPIVMMLLALIACGNNKVPDTNKVQNTITVSDTKDSPQPTVDLVVEGYEDYKDAETGIELKYPETWWVVDNETVFESLEMEESVASMFNVSEKRVDQALEELVFSLYDLDNGTEDYMPNINLGVIQNPGIKQSTFGDEAILSMIKSATEEQYTQYLGSFTWYKEPNAEKFGKNNYLCLALNYELNGLPLTVFLAVTELDGKQYSFGYTMLDYMPSKETDEVFANILTSFEVKK